MISREKLKLKAQIRKLGQLSRELRRIRQIPMMKATKIPPTPSNLNQSKKMMRRQTNRTPQINDWSHRKALSTLLTSSRFPRHDRPSRAIRQALEYRRERQFE